VEGTYTCGTSGVPFVGQLRIHVFGSAFRVFIAVPQYPQATDPSGTGMEPVQLLGVLVTVLSGL